jgi:hypothetical protein
VSNHCSLRGAIEVGNALSRAVLVNVPAMTIYLNTELQAMDSGGIKVVGAGATKTKIDASYANSRVIEVVGLQSTLTLNNLTVTHGSANSAPDNSGEGGAIYVGNLSDQLVLNSVTVSSSGAQYGGGIYTVGSLWMSNSTVSGNSALHEGGGLETGGYVAQLTNNTISGNVVTSADEAGGGGVADDNGMTMVGGSVSNNTVNVPSNSYSFGGGIFVGEGSTIAGTKLSGNVVQPASGAINVTVEGGAIGSTYGLGLLDNVTMANNHATSNGSGFATGGGFADIYGTTRMANDTIQSNSVTSLGSGTASGGGVSAWGKCNCWTVFGGDLDITNSKILSNSANASAGEAMGGGLYLSQIAAATVTKSSISSNAVNSELVATTDYAGGGGVADRSCGGGLNIDSSTINSNTANNGQGGGVLNDSCGEILTNTVISNNRATGEAISTNSGNNGNGGGLALWDTTVMQDDTVSHNSATSAGGDDETFTGVDIVANHAVYGAGLYESGHSRFVDSAIVDNAGASGSSEGGGFYLAQSGSAEELSDTDVAGNVAASGGGVFLAHGTVVTEGSQISGNFNQSHAASDCVFVSGQHFGSIGGNINADGSCSLGANPLDRSGSADQGYLLFSPAGKGFGFNFSAIAGPKVSGHIVAAVRSSDNAGYWLVNSAGTVFAYGSASSHGSASAMNVTAMAATPDGKGYWLVGSTGTVKAFGTAPLLGSVSGQSIVSIMATPDGRGYWLVSSKGTVHAFGTATNFGSTSGASIVAAIEATDGQGYWLVSANGAVHAFGSAKSHGGATGKKIVAAATSPDGQGYWLFSSNGAVYPFGSAKSFGSLASKHLSSAISAGFGL